MGRRHENAEEIKMECYYCRGKMEKGKTTYSISKNGYHLLIDDVMAWICTQCGEAYFNDNTVDAIQEAIKELDMQVLKVREMIIA